MTFDEIEESARILKRYDEKAFVDFTPEGGTFSVIFVNTQLSDKEVTEILDELLKMSFIDLSRTAVTDAGALLLTRASKLRVVNLPQGISVHAVRALMQLPTVRSVSVAIPSPPIGYEEISGWAGCWNSTRLQVNKQPIQEEQCEP